MFCDIIKLFLLVFKMASDSTRSCRGWEIVQQLGCMLR